MLNLDPWTILWTGINLVVLYLLMRRFLFKPVNAVMEQRAQAIQESLSQAEEAKQQGQREYDRIISSAQADAQAIRSDAQVQLEAQRRQMLQEAQQQVAALALLAAAKVSGRSMDAQDDRDLVEDFLREAGDL